MFDTLQHCPIACCVSPSDSRESSSKAWGDNSDLKSETNHSVSPANRVFWPDLLRIVSAFAVVLLHVAGGRALQLQPGDTQSMSIIFCRVLPSFAVPVFFMLSGMFFLDPNRRVDIRKSVCGCRRLLIAFAFWSAFYPLVFPPHRLFLGQFLKGPGYLWFLPALASCYLAAPGLRAIARDCKAESALLIVVFFLLCVPATLRALSDSFRRVLPTTITILSMPVFLVLLGDYLHRFPITGIRRRVLLFVGTSSFLFAIAATGLLAKEGTRIDVFVNADQAHVVLFSAAVFTFFQSAFSGESCPQRLRRIVAEVAKCTFGVYLIHQLFVKTFPMLPGPAISDILLRSVICFALSLAATAILRRIPVLRMVVT